MDAVWGLQRMRLWMNEPGLRESWPGALNGGATVVRWTEESSGLPVEECARNGIEALAGFLISRDALEISDSPDEMFCTCVEMYHAATGTDGDISDYIGVYFRVVEFKDATYPIVGPRSFKMLMQPLSNGNIIARWNAIDHTSHEAEALHDTGPMANDVNTRSSVSWPLTLGAIPVQGEEDANLPSFLLLRDPGAGWQIWRRYSPMAVEGSQTVNDGVREETYTMVYPLMDAKTNWRFRIHDLPQGGVQVQAIRGAQG